MNQKVFGVASTLLIVASSSTGALGVFTEQISAAENPVAEAVQKKEKQKQAPYRNIMYYGDWSVWDGQANFYPKDIPANQLTHLNYSFMDFDAEGNLAFCDPGAATDAPVGLDGVGWNEGSAGLLNAFQDLRGRNPNLKIGLSVGGWSKSANFTHVAANPTIRKKFVDNLMRFLRYTNMDFLDIDWEYPNFVREPDKVDNKNDNGTPDSKPEDKENYIILLQDIREALDKLEKKEGKNYELSVALPISPAKLEAGIDIKRLFDVVDFANIMTYDANGAWQETTGHHTPLYGNPDDPNYDAGFSVDQSVKYLQANGAPKEKIIIGTAFYSRGWKKVEEGSNKALPGLFQKAALVNTDADGTPSYGADHDWDKMLGDSGRATGVWAWRNHGKLKEKFPGLKEYWDDTAKAPYMYDKSSGGMFTYDNKRSIGYKTDYVKDNNLGGVITWMASQDKPSTPGSKVRDDLTKTIKQGLFGDEALPKQNIKASGADVTVDISTYTNWKSGYKLTVRNNEKPSERDPALQLAQQKFQTIKLPKFYIPVIPGETLSSGEWSTGQVTTKNGYVEIDLSTVYQGKQITPNSSYVLHLSTTASTPDPKRIKTIEMTQRITKSSSEINRQYVYGKGEELPEPEVDTQAPTVPTNLKATEITENSISFNWKASTDNVKVKGYKVYRNGQFLGNTTATNYVDKNLKAETTYNYTVKAFDEAGNESIASTPLTATTKEAEPEVDTQAPTVPQNLRASNVTTSTATIKWDASTDNVGVVGYQVFRDGKLIETTTQTEHKAINLSADTAYKYTVKAFDDEGNISKASSPLTVITKEDNELEEDTQAPTIPENLKASNITETSAQIKWDASSDNVEVAGYQVFRDGKLVKITDKTNYQDDQLKANTTYKYTVKAFDHAGNVSKASAALTVQTKAELPTEPEVDTEAPTVPTNLKSSNISETEATIQWNASTDNVAVAGYQVFRDGKLVKTTVNTKFVDSELKAGTTYKYTVKAFDEAGNTSKASTALTVKTKEQIAPTPENQWVATKAYTGGQIVSYNGKTYKAKWWTRGDIPGISQWGPWELISGPTDPTDPTDPVDPEESTDPIWEKGTVYVAGNRVSYKGHTYKAKWWTRGDIPGANQWGPWELVK